MRPLWLLVVCAAVVLASSDEPGSGSGEAHAETKAEAAAYERLSQVATKLSKVQRDAAAEQLKANDLMDDELHHLNTIGSLTLAQRKHAKEIENKRYKGVHEERLEADKNVEAQRSEIKDLKQELSKANVAHEVAAKASEKKDKQAKIAYLNERSHKHNAKEEKTKSKKEATAKAVFKRNGEKLLKANEKREREYKASREKEMVADHSKKRDATEAIHSKAKAEAKMAQSTVNNLSDEMVKMRDRDTYFKYVDKYKAAVHVEDQKLENLKMVEKKKKAQEERLTDEKTKFEALKKKQKQEAAAAKENHEKAVAGQQNRNCNKMCRLYRVATDTTSTQTRAKVDKKDVCFAEPKQATEESKKQEEEQEDKEQKQAEEVEKQQQKQEEEEEKDDDDDAQEKKADAEDEEEPPSIPKLIELLSEVEDSAGCVGMECTCKTYSSYEGTDDMDSIDNSGVVHMKQRN